MTVPADKRCCCCPLMQAKRQKEAQVAFRQAELERLTVGGLSGKK